MNRAISALAGAVITYFILIIFEQIDFSIIVDLLFGNEIDGYVNLHSLILIISMMIIVQISNEAGLFQFLAASFIKASNGKPIRLMLILCCVIVLIAAILNNLLAVIIMIPLTVTVSRILNIDPSPYILTEAVIVNLGGSLFIISSIPNILIATYAKITFIEFFVNVGLFSLIIFGFTLFLFSLLYKKELNIPKEGFNIFKEFNVWNYIQNKRLLYESALGLLILMILFIIVPSTIIPPDMIALAIAIILVIISKLEPKEIISKIDFELILYLLGIFIISGALEVLDVLSFIGGFLSGLTGGDLFIQIILILWFSAFLSSAIDNIPITKVLIPVVSEMTSVSPSVSSNQIYYSLAIGSNWGDNLTPLGDNILVLNLAEQNKRPVSFKKFFKLGFFTTICQLLIISLIYTLTFYLFLGVTIILTLVISILMAIIMYKMNIKRVGFFLYEIIEKIRKFIVS